ncbi:MAG: methyltransferase domain-containing protein [Acidimicrobiales bacterium]
MGAEDTHGLGYERVDDDPNVQVLLATMDTTSQWTATRELRAWEREVLRLVEGERLLDVGCGLGEAAMTLAEDLGGAGEVVGIDASSAMLGLARERATPPPCRVRFSLGDALALEEPDRSFDAVRSERTLQWVADPQVAVDELARVVRPGGRVSLIDTDWSTFRLDVGDAAITDLVREAMRDERSRPSNVGRRLGVLARAAGLLDGGEKVATQVWTAWNPDASPAPDGCFSMRSLADDLIERGHLGEAERADFISTVHDAARQGRFSMSLTMYAHVAIAPASTHTRTGLS